MARTGALAGVALLALLAWPLFLARASRCEPASAAGEAAPVAAVTPPTSARQPVPDATPPSRRPGRHRSTPSPCSMPTSRPCSAISTTPASTFQGVTIEVLPARRPVLRPHRRARRPARGLRGQVHVRRRARCSSTWSSCPAAACRRSSVTWDARPREQGGQRWFRQYPDEKIDHADELHWTRRRRTGTSCAPTATRPSVQQGLRRRRTTRSRRPAPRSRVGCEACHGPGLGARAWADATRRSEAGKGLDRAARRAPGRGVGARRGRQRRCAARRARPSAKSRSARSAMRAVRRSPRAIMPGRPFLDHYLPALLTPTLYHDDGQQQDEVFIWGSWHAEPHARRRASPAATATIRTRRSCARRGNAVCAQCHEPARSTTRLRITVTSRGSHGRAVRQLPHAAEHVHGRRPAARPQHARARGPMKAWRSACRTPATPATPTATRSGRRRAVRDWLGRDAAGYQTFAAVFHAAESGEPPALDALAAVAADTAQPAMVRASALARLAGSGQFTRDFAEGCHGMRARWCGWRRCSSPT